MARSWCAPLWCLTWWHTCARPPETPQGTKGIPRGLADVMQSLCRRTEGFPERSFSRPCPSDPAESLQAEVCELKEGRRKRASASALAIAAPFAECANPAHRGGFSETPTCICRVPRVAGLTVCSGKSFPISRSSWPTAGRTGVYPQRKQTGWLASSAASVGWQISEENCFALLCFCLQLTPPLAFWEKPAETQSSQACTAFGSGDTTRASLTGPVLSINDGNKPTRNGAGLCPGACFGTTAWPSRELGGDGGVSQTGKESAHVGGVWPGHPPSGTQNMSIVCPVFF